MAHRSDLAALILAASVVASGCQPPTPAAPCRGNEDCTADQRCDTVRGYCVALPVDASGADLSGRDATGADGWRRDVAAVDGHTDRPLADGASDRSLTDHLPDLPLTDGSDERDAAGAEPSLVDAAAADSWRDAGPVDQQWRDRAISDRTAIRAENEAPEAASVDRHLRPDAAVGVDAASRDRRVQDSAARDGNTHDIRAADSRRLDRTGIDTLPYASPDSAVAFDSGSNSDSVRRDVPSRDQSVCDAAVTSATACNDEDSCTMLDTCIGTQCVGLPAEGCSGCVSTCDDNCYLSATRCCSQSCVSDCSVDCAYCRCSLTCDNVQSSTCEMVCNTYSVCSVYAQGSGAARLNCLTGANCLLDCSGVADCFLQCPNGAQCLLHCGNSGGCDKPLGCISCGFNWWACNRPCPTP